MALSTVLVANRGEIARRVIRAIHGLGLEAVAVFADDDRDAPHTAEADRAVALGGGGVGATYLDLDRIMWAATASGADALHPGYGFLAEDPRLAEACTAAGVAWVGPPAAAMAAMGHKAQAKATVAAAGVSVLPSQVVADGDDPATLAQEVGYPLLVKASAGGGGRGMRLVENESELAASVDAARREAASAFGSDEVFLERYVAGPRHVEVQVLADRHGKVVHLFDRDCSVQRRHQKIIEEAPASAVAYEVRQRMWAAAVEAARAVGYEGAGTVEFLVSGDEFFFLEMNTRLQVEHGVTELITGLDLVELQLRIAAGEPLPFIQARVSVTGHALEARVCAERPTEDFRPTPGPVLHAAWPAGDGVRVDAGVESGSVVSAAYDSLVAKVMAHGHDRYAALARLSRALDQLELDGLETNRALLSAVLGEHDFVTGEAVGTDYLERHPEVIAASPNPGQRARHAAAAALYLEHVRAGTARVRGVPASWRNLGAAWHMDALNDGTEVWETWVSRRGGAVTVAVEPGGWRMSGRVRGGTVELEEAGLITGHRVRWHGPLVCVNGPDGQSSFTMHVEGEEDTAPAAAGECRAPLPGGVTKVLVATGDPVQDGTALVVLEAMKMEHTLRAAGSGVVAEVLVAEGQQVDVGELLLRVEQG